MLSEIHGTGPIRGGDLDRVSRHLDRHLRVSTPAAAEIAIATTREHGAAFEIVRLIAFDEETLAAYRETLSRIP